MRHACVTGGAGFIGSHLATQLLADGWRVTALDNFDPFYPREVKTANLRALLAHPHFRLLEVDCCDGDRLREELTGDIDVIVHLAAKAGVRPSIQQPLAYYQANVLGTQQMLELARALGVPQFVFASSSSVYGINPHVPWREDEAVLQPISPYASTKVSGELLGHVYSHLFGIRFVALRFFTVYGPRQRPDLAIHAFARRMLAGDTIPIFGDGGMRRDFTYIDDIVRGIRAAMHYERSPYAVFNLGNHHTVSVLEMVRTLEDALGVTAHLAFQPEQPGDVPITYAAIEKAQHLLGYAPATPFPTGIDRFCAWLLTSAPPASPPAPREETPRPADSRAA